MHDHEPTASDTVRPPLDRPDGGDKVFWITVVLFLVLFLAQTVRLGL